MDTLSLFALFAHFSLSSHPENREERYGKIAGRRDDAVQRGQYETAGLLQFAGRDV